MGEVISIDEQTWKVLLSFRKNIKFFQEHPTVYSEALAKTKALYSLTIENSAA